MFSSQQEIVFAIVTILTALLVVLVVFLLFGIVTQRKVMRLHERLLQAEILSIEKERERVASDLHDSLGSRLNGIRVIVDQIRTTDTGSIQLREEAVAGLEKVQKQVGQIARNITPRILEDATVENAVKMVLDECKLLSELNGIHLVIKVDAKIVLPKEKLLHIYRIVQEVMNNIHKHSYAKEVNFTCLFSDQYVSIACNDDGVGYDVTKNSDGLGLSNIQNRVFMLGGHHHVKSTKGKGTEVVIRIPVG